MPWGLIRIIWGLSLINDDGEDNFVSMIIQRSHPHYDEIVSIFSSEIQVLSDMK